MGFSPQPRGPRKPRDLMPFMPDKGVAKLLDAIMADSNVDPEFKVSLDEAREVLAAKARSRPVVMRAAFGGREPIDRTKLESYGPCTACKSTEMTYQPGVRGLDVPERQGVPEDVVCGECGYVVASGLDPAERERWDREIDRE